MRARPIKCTLPRNGNDAIALCLHRSFTNRANSWCDGGGGDGGGDEGKGGVRRAYTRYRTTIIG